ncbi:MAG: hypothetical protein MI865_02545, partial [Proteobacteria bacterium]|nr:hypothetical protein [Pseudomonadota bacterium]
RFILITSYARVNAEKDQTDEAKETDIKGLYVYVTPSKHEKCIRCWHHREDVGSHKDHPELCGRCVKNISI